MAAGRWLLVLPDLHELRTDPVWCMIRPSDGCGLRGWRAGWDGRTWRVRRGWRAQQVARGLREDTIAPRERLVRRFGEFAGDYPWAWSPGHMDEWSLHLTAEKHLAPSTIRSYQCTLRQFSEFLVDGRYGWAAACEEAFGPGRHPVAVCHEWNTIAHLNDYEGDPEARPFTREEMQRFLDY